MPWSGNAARRRCADKSFAGAVGFGDEVDVAFVLGAHAAMIEVAQQRAGLARDGFGGGKKLGHARVPRRRRARTVRRRPEAPPSVMVRICAL